MSDRTEPGGDLQETEPLQTIVAEITKNWPEETEGLTSQRFQYVIEYNRKRGYALQSWQFTTVYDPINEILTDTIIAVFCLIDRP